MLTFVLSITLTGLLTAAYARFIRGVDRFEQEPARYLAAAFAWGAVPAIIVATVLQLALGLPIGLAFGEGSLGGGLIDTAVIAPVTEEALKGLAVAMIAWRRRREFDGWVDGLVYGAMAGLGFGFVENVLYLLGTESWGEWLALFVIRVAVFGFMHGFWTSLTGIGFGIARESTRRGRKLAAILGGLSLAVLSHLLHNSAMVLADLSGGATLLIAVVNYAALLIGLFILRALAVRNDRQIMRTYLRDEAPDVISPEDYAALCQPQAHAQARLRLAPPRRRAFIQLAAELAQKKRQLVKLGDETGNTAEIARLRQQLVKSGEK